MKFTHIFIFILSVGLFAGCEDLAELNENPNQPEDVGPDVLLTAATRGAVNSLVTESFLIGNNAAQLTAKTLRAEVDVYDWNAFPTVWEEQKKALANLGEMMQRARALSNETGNTTIEGVATVMEVYLFSVLTNAYGDIPYSEAITGSSSGNFFPKYDRQEDIYLGPVGMLEELRIANDLLDPAAGAVGGDILFGGDIMKWKKFCNSLRLRLLMHVSNKTDVSAEFNDIVMNEPIMTSNDDNAALVYLSNFPNEFPLIPLKQGDFDAVVMSDRSIAVMEGYNDPRLDRFARPDNILNLATEDPMFDGADNGSENASLCDKSGSRLGLAYYNYPGHPIAAQADGLLMTWAEVEFLLAEGALKGWISADPAVHYRNGIQASMEYYQVNFMDFGWSDFNDFYSNSGVAYDPAEPVKIWEQKWLSLFFTGLEPYFEVRRWLAENSFDWDAVPFVRPTCQNVNDDKLPVRFPYPGEEQSLNTENYNEAVERLGSNSQNALMWLLDF